MLIKRSLPNHIMLKLEMSVCIKYNNNRKKEYLYFVSGFFNSCLQPSGVRMLLGHLTWNILHQGLQYLFCCHNLLLARGSPCSQALVEWKALEACTVFMSFCLKELNEKASLDHGWSISDQGKILIFQLWSVYGTAKSLCRKKSAAIHRGFWLLKQSFCQCDTSHVFASGQLEVFFKHAFPSKQFSKWMYKPHIWICIGWSRSRPKVSTHQGSDFLMVFSTKRQEAATYFAFKCSVPSLNIYHEMLLELFWTMNIQHIFLFEVVN